MSLKSFSALATPTEGWQVEHMHCVSVCTNLSVCTKLQAALLYDILPPKILQSTDYAKGLGKLSANGQFFVSAQINGSKFVTETNDARRFLNNHPRCLRQHERNQNRLNRDGTLLFFFFCFTRSGRASCLHE